MKPAWADVADPQRTSPQAARSELNRCRGMVAVSGSDFRRNLRRGFSDYGLAYRQLAGWVKQGGDEFSDFSENSDRPSLESIL